MIGYIILTACLCIISYFVGKVSVWYRKEHEELADDAEHYRDMVRTLMTSKHISELPPIPLSFLTPTHTNNIVLTKA